MRILLIEDEKKIADFIPRGMKEEGYCVDVANDGENRYFFASTEAYDLIVLDLMLPKMDGITLCKSLTSSPQLQKKYKGASIIIGMANRLCTGAPGTPAPQKLPGLPALQSQGSICP